MPTNKSIILLFQFSLLFSISGYGSEQAEDTTIIPVGWNIQQPFNHKHAIVYSSAGDYGFTKYWEINCCGAPAPEYKILPTADSLAAYWKNLKDNCDSLEMPKVDFKKNILLIVRPGKGNTRFKYKISSTMKNCDINFVVTQFLASKWGALIEYHPLLAFELPKPGSAQKINVKINVDSRVFGSFPK